MKRILAATCLALLAAAPAYARETRVEQPLQALLDSQEAKDAGIDGSVKFYLAGQPHPAVVESFGSDVSNRKTNAANKSDEAACRWVTLSVLKALQDGAKAKGANAVIDVVSFYKAKEFSSPTSYECYAGAILAGMALKGTYAKVK
ncbi:excinuclease ATPase subunit [Stenotrophomonas sp. HITSZ_GD]|uniref:excinuclease ATPase subunit n=1 Tax=Stenotrophomonas sp. HITSZ_GD TaxID=3037248 RepID=UPI00240DB502|nr:excinuclease ATPase subunit [Stenotrophomonas sp. HITSZ_GD]MDG2525331.1 excinuclease ATPase subunit [Stenotrophomonas sp. HITSZ_GD]